MKYCSVTAYPYAVVQGSIEIPDSVDNVDGYVSEHFDDINFGSPYLDFEDADYNVEVVETLYDGDNKSGYNNDQEDD